MARERATTKDLLKLMEQSFENEAYIKLLQKYNDLLDKHTELLQFCAKLLKQEIKEKEND